MATSTPPIVPPGMPATALPEGPQASNSAFNQFVFVTLAAYVVVNRLIATLYTVPVGISLRPSELVLLIMAGILVWRVALDPGHYPRGSVALFGLAVITLVLVAPSLHTSGFSPFQASAMDQGIVRAILLMVLFLASYQVGWDHLRSRKLLTVIIFMSAVEGLIAIYEGLTGGPMTWLGEMWVAVGLEADPNSATGVVNALQQRLTGEIRAAATAPHPLVLSAVLAVALIACFVLFLSADTTKRKRRLAFTGVLLLASTAMTNSRTGFILLIACGALVAILNTHRMSNLVSVGLIAVLGLPVLAIMSPSTPRLLLNSFTGSQPDHNLDVRVERFARLPEMLSERPFIGAGYLTHDPSIIIFDNAYNLALIELGTIGLGLIVGFFIVITWRCASAAMRFRRHDPVLATMGAVAGASMLLGALTFDAWTFDQFLPTMFILMGMGVARADVLDDQFREEDTADRVSAQTP